MTAVLLLATIAALVWFTRTRFRGQRHWRWVRRAWIGIGLPVGAGIAAIGRLDLPTHRPREFDALAAALPDLPDATGMFVTGLCGIALGLIARGMLRHRIRVPARLAAVVPRTRGEAAGAAAMAVTAGIVEEAMFRMWLPWLIALVSGSAAFGFVVATLVFAALHRNQGVVGVLGAGAVGGMMAVLYLSTGALWLAVALHAAFNLNALLMTAWLSSSAATPSERSSRSRGGTAP